MSQTLSVSKLAAMSLVSAVIAACAGSRPATNELAAKLRRQRRPQ